jgi:serine phosphatase RsbU (regulator of sigma subunit)/tetratricopeptide (TPR) repeat protein
VEKKNTQIVSLLDIAKNRRDTAQFFRLRREFWEKAESENNLQLKASLYHSTGVLYYYLGDYENSLGYFDKAVNFEKQNNLELSLISSLMNRGAIFYTRQEYYNALMDYLASERLMQKLHSPRLGGVYSNIAMLYNELGDLRLAEDYNKKAIPFVKKINDTEGLAKVYNNLGLLEKKKGNFDAADSLFREGLKLAREHHYERDVSDMIFNLSGVLMLRKKYNEALKYRLEMMDLVKKTKEPDWEKMIGLDIAFTYHLLGDDARSKKYLEQAEAIGWSGEENFSEKMDYYATLGEMQSIFKNYPAAATAFSVAYELRLQQEAESDLTSLEKVKYENERRQDSISFAKQKQIDDLNNEKLQQEAQHKLSRQRIFTGISILVLLVIGFFSVFLLKANRQKEAANTELKEQKRLVSEKNTEITDSIQYSLRIQQSLLPSGRKLSHYLPSHFLIYSPKDIVSGDFYWLQDIGGGEVLVAVADCTGHGVPGAIMSALSIQQLNGISRTVREPSKILQRLNKKLKENLKQEEEGNSKDGLDICLCRLNIAERKAVYSGANRNLWIFDRSGLKREIKATKAGIAGYTTSEQNYGQHEISLEPGDCLVMSSDGFADQFGGPDNKKITTKRFKSWVAETSFEERSARLQELFGKWKGEHEQIDDVCVLGFILLPET